MEAKLGDYIITGNHNHYGRVYSKHHNFANTNENDQWFDSQIPKLPESTKTENWYSVLCNQARAVLVPESDIRRVSDQPIGEFKNPWESHYFRKTPIINRILYGIEAKEFYATAIVELEKRNNKQIMTDNTVCLKVAVGGYWRDEESNLYFAFDNWSHDLTVEEFDLEEEAAKYANGQTAITTLSMHLYRLRLTLILQSSIWMLSMQSKKCWTKRISALKMPTGGQTKAATK
jgi:hypothetical protein